VEINEDVRTSYLHMPGNFLLPMWLWSSTYSLVFITSGYEQEFLKCVCVCSCFVLKERILIDASTKLCDALESHYMKM
jgi:hypothetical protein